MEVLAFEESKTAGRAIARMRAPATCGELIQGCIAGRDFLVNCPIDLYARAEVLAAKVDGLHLRRPARHSKIRDVVALAEQEYFLQLRHQLEIYSEIPRGKGMASSTADITAALYALLLANDVAIDDAAFARLITEVEPSDCVHFPGIGHVNHLTGELNGLLPPPKNLKVMAFDCGGEIDTIGFDRQHARSVYRDNQGAMINALTMLERGLLEDNLQWVADAATGSAILSQLIHPKPQFEELLSIAKSVGALGVNCAHSGSVLGVLYRASEHLKERLSIAIEMALGTSVSLIGDFRIIGGGCSEY